MNTISEMSDLLVFSHFRWDFVYQRPHHLLSRQAKYRRVFYFEEPVLGMTEVPRLHLRETSDNVLVVIPYLPTNIDRDKVEMALTNLVDELIYEEEIIDYTLCYYTPKAHKFTSHLEPRAIIYECSSITDEEEGLSNRADLIFTSGPALQEFKSRLYSNVHSFPSAVDYQHFSQARLKLVEPDDQINIQGPRIGFYGVIDEKFDFELLMKVAELRPQYQFVVAGPLVGVDSRSLPRRSNVHYLGKKDYHALPLYLSGWECTIVPLKESIHNEFIFPVKMKEYLAAGKPVISTPIPDIVQSIGKLGLIHIASTSSEFASSIDLAIENKSDQKWINKIEAYLKDDTWDKIFQEMLRLEDESLQSKLKIKETPRIIHPMTLPVSGAV